MRRAAAPADPRPAAARSCGAAASTGGGSAGGGSPSGVATAGARAGERGAATGEGLRGRSRATCTRPVGEPRPRYSVDEPAHAPRPLRPGTRGAGLGNLSRETGCEHAPPGRSAGAGRARGRTGRGLGGRADGPDEAARGEAEVGGRGRGGGGRRAGAGGLRDLRLGGVDEDEGNAVVRERVDVHALRGRELAVHFFLDDLGHFLDNHSLTVDLNGNVAEHNLLHLDRDF